MVSVFCDNKLDRKKTKNNPRTQGLNIGKLIQRFLQFFQSAKIGQIGVKLNIIGDFKKFDIFY